MNRPNARSAALLLLRLIEAKETKKSSSVSRFRVSDITLRRLWNRYRIEGAFVTEVSEVLLDAGWALFFTGRHYAMIKTDMVEGWVRLSSKGISEELVQVRAGAYDFKDLERLIPSPAVDGDEDAD